MKIATLAIITRKRGGKKEILLGRKYSESEIGAGKLNGPGGKFDPREGDRTILGCLYREVIEEFGIFLNLREATKVAIITFYANSVPDFEVHVFRADSFSGKPRETKSMKKPEWHDTSKMPYEEMHDGDEKFFPQLLEGERFLANLYYSERAKDFKKIDFFPFVQSD